MRRGRRSGTFVFAAVHSTARGPALGGCRLWSYDDSRAALRDVLRLSRTMTYKAAAADLPLGGGKGVIMVGPRDRLTPSRRRQALLDFGDAVAMLGGRYITAEDVGTSSRDMRLIARETAFVAGLPRSRGGSGDPSPFTALGVDHAIRASCAHAFGSDSLRGRTICVVGLGHVGSRVARRLARAGANLLVSDIDRSKRQLAERLGARWIAPGRWVEAEADVLAPCALGGIFDQESVRRLRCRVIAGAANNQLAGPAVAGLLAEAGILWAPDFVAGAGGLINIAEEWGGYDPAQARRRVAQIADTLRGVFAEADAAGVTPLSAAMALAERRLAA
jgi:leucine dehydrogenase